MKSEGDCRNEFQVEESFLGSWAAHGGAHWGVFLRATSSGTSVSLRIWAVENLGSHYTQLVLS